MEVVILVIGLAGTGLAVTLAKRDQRRKEQALAECFAKVSWPTPRQEPERLDLNP